MPKTNDFYSMRKIRAEGGGVAGRIDIYGEISSTEFWGDEKTPAKFISDLSDLGPVSEINVHIFSSGGDPFAALAMYAEIKRRPEKVNVYIDGIAASAATLIMCAGDTVYMDETSMLMVHNPYQLICFEGLNADAARELADELDKIREPMITAYMKKSGKTREQVIAVMDGEGGQGTWFTAGEALEFGLADAYTPEEKTPLEAVALIRPGIYSYKGRKIDLTKFDKAAEKTAGITNRGIGGTNKVAFWNEKKKNKEAKAGQKKKPRAEITFVEMVCPSCSGAVYLNPETGETLTSKAQPDGQGAGDATAQDSATFARRLPGNARAALYVVDCPHCGEEFAWDTDSNSDGDTGETVTDAEPAGTAGADDDSAQAQSDTSASDETAVCPSCGASVVYDTATAATGTDDAGTEGYSLTCPECQFQFVEPYAAAESDAIPVGAPAHAAYRMGIRAERRRMAELDELEQAAPGSAAMIRAAKKSGASADTMRRNVIKALAKGGANGGAGKFIDALNRDLQASGVNNMPRPGHHDKKAAFANSVFDALDNR